MRNRHPAPDIDVFAGQPKPAADPQPVLRRLLKVDSPYVEPYGASGDLVCFWCGATEHEGHRNDCPYVEAVTLFGDPNAQDAPRGVINP